MRLGIPQSLKNRGNLMEKAYKPEFFEVIDYWCNKDIRGLIQMPFSRHWIMHTEACLRVKNKIHP